MCTIFSHVFHRVELHCRQGHDGIMAGRIPDRMDHMILKLSAYNSESWSHIQQLSFNPRLR